MEDTKAADPEPITEGRRTQEGQAILERRLVQGFFQSAVHSLLRNWSTNLHVAPLHWEKFKYSDLFASACKNTLPPTVKKAKTAVDLK